MPDPQIVTTGHIRENGGGGECIHFYVNLGLFSLKCIVNVPAEGQTEAPVYVKFRVREPREAKQETPRQKPVSVYRR